MNDVLISGPKEKITDLYNKIMDTGGLLEVMSPQGEWDYSNAVDKWGTKWDVDPENLEIEFEKEEGSISGTVDSAWSPPVEAFKTFLNNNPECVAELRYYESGMEFIGIFADGKNEYFEYDSNDINSLDSIPKDLVEHFNLEEELQMNFDESEEIWEDEY
jgi:hypothetical protein